MKEKDRLFINMSYRDSILKKIDEENILGCHLVKAIDIFFLAVALGMEKPVDIKGKKDGYFQVHNNIGTQEKSLFASLLLGKIENQKDVDKYANAQVNYDEAERCAESGFLILNEKIEAANGDEELLEKRLISELNLLYEKNVKSL